MIDPTTVITVLGSAFAATLGAGVTLVAARRGQKAQADKAESDAAVNYEGIANRATTRAELLLAAVAKLQDQSDTQLVWQRQATVLLQKCAAKDKHQKTAISELLELTHTSSARAVEVRDRIKQITDDVAEEKNGHANHLDPGATA